MIPNAYLQYFEDVQLTFPKPMFLCSHVPATRKHSFKIYCRFGQIQSSEVSEWLTAVLQVGLPRYSVLFLLYVYFNILVILIMALIKCDVLKMSEKINCSEHF